MAHLAIARLRSDAFRRAEALQPLQEFQIVLVPPNKDPFFNPGGTEGWWFCENHLCKLHAVKIEIKLINVDKSYRLAVGNYANSNLLI